MKKLTKYTLKKEKTDIERVQITCSKDAYKFCLKFYSDDIDVYESVFALFLDNTGNTIGYAKIAQGGVSTSIVDVPLIVKYAIESLSVGVVLCHNHPTGNLNPSVSDIKTSNAVKHSLTLIGINFYDNIIISKNHYYSFFENNQL